MEGCVDFCPVIHHLLIDSLLTLVVPFTYGEFLPMLCSWQNNWTPNSFNTVWLIFSELIIKPMCPARCLTVLCLINFGRVRARVDCLVCETSAVAAEQNRLASLLNWTLLSSFGTDILPVLYVSSNSINSCLKWNGWRVRKRPGLWSWAIYMEGPGNKLLDWCCTLNSCWLNIIHRRFHF